MLNARRAKERVDWKGGCRRLFQLWLISAALILPVAPSFAGSEANVEGLKAHEVGRAREKFKVDGSGVTVCVLSDSVRYLRDSWNISSRSVTVLDGLSGIEPDGKDKGEGTAMLEIVHSIAPGARLMFATVGKDPSEMTRHIEALHGAGCEIFVDDREFYAESPFQDGAVAKAINYVTSQGALYITSAGNQGNINSDPLRTSSMVWDGPYKPGRAVRDEKGKQIGVLHAFRDGLEYNEVVGECGREGGEITAYLHWNDATPSDGRRLAGGESTYRLVAVDAEGHPISKQDEQDKTPLRSIRFPAPNRTNSQRTFIGIVKVQGKADHLHLNVVADHAGCRLRYGTKGAISGHHGAEAAFSVAAKSAQARDSLLSSDGAFCASDDNVNFDSSEGPRKMFFAPDGSPSQRDVPKPDVTAADGVTTDVKGFEHFFGTSAAAPQVAGIAALMWSRNKKLSAEEIKCKLRRSASHPTKWDSKSGYGTVNAVRALEETDPPTAEISRSSDGRFARAGQDGR